MVEINLFLQGILYFCGIILLIVLITLGVKMLTFMDKANKVLDNVEEKVNSFNALFDIVEKVNNSVSSITDAFVDKTKDHITKLFNKRHKKEDIEEDDEYV